MTRYGRMTRLFAAAGMAALVAACDENRRGVDAPPPAPLAELEGVSALPYAEPAQVQYYEPERAYPYAERAYGVQRAFYDAPPDYGFAYDDVSPYVWETADDWALYAEPYEGDYRYYYYEPGAAYPYFVRDHDYGYAYSAAGLLIAMFYSDGRYVPVDVAYRYAPVAGRYYARGRDLRRVGRGAERIQVDDRAWVTDAPRVSRGADPWLRAARDDRRWREWRERDGDRELRRFAVETQRRQAAAGAWRERTARENVATIARGQDRLEAQALKARREGVRDDRRRAAEERGRAEASGRQTEQRAKAERQRRDALAQAQRRQAIDMPQDQTRREPRAARAERPRAQAAEPRRQDRAELQRRAEAASMRDRRQQAQGETLRAEQAQRRAQQQRQQAQAERPVVPEQPQQQARAPAAAERGRPAAAREDVGKDRGRSKDERRKD
jgi:hypothetical protein